MSLIESLMSKSIRQNELSIVQLRQLEKEVLAKEDIEPMLSYMLLGFVHEREQELRIAKVISNSEAILYLIELAELIENDSESHAIVGKVIGRDQAFGTYIDHNLLIKFIYQPELIAGYETEADMINISSIVDRLPNKVAPYIEWDFMLKPYALNSALGTIINTDFHLLSALFGSSPEAFTFFLGVLKVLQHIRTTGRDLNGFELPQELNHIYLGASFEWLLNRSGKMPSMSNFYNQHLRARVVSGITRKHPEITCLGNPKFLPLSEYFEVVRFLAEWENTLEV